MKKYLSAVAAALVATSCNCGPKAMTPEVIERDIPARGDPVKRDYVPFVPDAGPEIIEDAGVCCEVRFAFRSLGGESQAVLVGPTFRHPVLMTLDGGVWEASVCMYPVDSYYHGVLSIPGDEPDSGTIEVTTFNPNAPTVPHPEFGTINRFVANGFMTCSELDAGAYGDTSVLAFDAGDADGGVPGDAGAPTDAGALTDAGNGDAGQGNDAGATDAGASGPTKTTIAGNCDTFTTPTVLLTSTNNSPVLDDHFAATTALPFSMNYFGTPVTHYAVNLNGYLQLLTSANGPTTASDNAPIPSAAPPNGVVAPLWDDMVSALTGTSALRTQVFGSGNTRHLTVEWQNLAFLFGEGPERVTFQAKFFEGTNAIEFHYCALSANGASGSFEQGVGATVGIENLAGTAGVQHSSDSAVLTTSSALHFE